MGNVLITYDIKDDGKKNPSIYSLVKEKMKSMGYLDSWNMGDGKLYLPNTTLWKLDSNCEQCKTDLLTVAKELKAEVERLVSVEFTVWDGINGKPYTSKL